MRVSPIELIELNGKWHSLIVTVHDGHRQRYGDNPLSGMDLWADLILKKAQYCVRS